jgi:hypothetical protein
MLIMLINRVSFGSKYESDKDASDGFLILGSPFCCLELRRVLVGSLPTRFRCRFDCRLSIRRFVDSLHSFISLHQRATSAANDEMNECSE